MVRSCSPCLLNLISCGRFIWIEGDLSILRGVIMQQVRHQKIRLVFFYHLRKNEISGSLVINLHNIGSFPITLNFLTVMTATNFFGWTAISRWNGWCDPHHITRLMGVPLWLSHTSGSATLNKTKSHGDFCNSQNILPLECF